MIIGKAEISGPSASTQSVAITDCRRLTAQKSTESEVEIACSPLPKRPRVDPSTPMRARLKKTFKTESKSWQGIMTLLPKPQDGNCVYHCLASISDPSFDHAPRIHTTNGVKHVHIGDLVAEADRAVELQNARELKIKILDWMLAHPEEFEQLLPEGDEGTVMSIQEYVESRKLQDKWGSDLEIMAYAEMQKCRIVTWRFKKGMSDTIWDANLFGHTGETYHLLFQPFGHYDKLKFRPTNANVETKRQIEPQSSSAKDEMSDRAFAIVEIEENGLTGLRVGQYLKEKSRWPKHLVFEKRQGDTTKGANSTFSAIKGQKGVECFTCTASKVLFTFPKLAQSPRWSKLPASALTFCSRHPAKIWLP